MSANTAARAGAQAQADFNKTRALFMKAASAPELPGNVCKLAYLIAFQHMDVHRRTAWVGQDKLAAELGGITVRAVQKLIARLRPLGLIVVTGKGPGQANVYRIEPKAENANYSSPIRGSEKANSGRRKTRTGETENANYSSPLLKESPISKGNAPHSPCWGERARCLRQTLPSIGARRLAAPPDRFGSQPNRRARPHRRSKRPCPKRLGDGRKRIRRNRARPLCRIKKRRRQARRGPRCASCGRCGRGR